MSPVLSRVATGQGFGSIVSYKRAYLASQGGGAYQISRSLRFNSADSAYLNRTPASPSNRRTFTWSGWVKRSGLGADQQLFFAAPSTSDTSHIRFDSDNTLNVFEYAGGYTWRLQTTQVFRDCSAWYHILVSIDTTQATSSNRVKIYVNGVEITTLSTASYPTQNTDTEFNNTVLHTIGSNPFYGNYFDGYLADVHFIDGQALTPSSFTETSLLTGQLIPKTYSGSYGTNGFKLNFSSNASTAALGTDSSGNNNTWAVNNFIVSSANIVSYTVTNTSDAFNAFDGNLSTYWLPNANSSSLLTFATPVTGTSFRFYMGASLNTTNFQINGSAPSGFSGSKNQDWYDFSSHIGGTLSSIQLSYVPAQYSQYVYAIEVDGAILYDNRRAAANDSLVDAPTSYGTDTGVGAEVRGNYATFNPLSGVGSGLSNGNLDVSGTSCGFHGTIAVTSGKWYFEFVKNANGDNQLGISTGYANAAVTSFRRAWRDAVGSPTFLTDGGNAGSGTAQSLAVGDILGVALDMDNNAVYFAKNNVWMNSGVPTSGASKTGAIWTDLAGSAWQVYAGANANGCYTSLNAGARAFAYTAPSGFKALVDTNLTAPAIVLSNTAFDTKLYTGNGSTNVITGLGFSPDFVWLKNRSDADGWHQFRDIVRGGDRNLASNSTLAETDASNKNLIFDSAGFTLTGTTGSADDNQNGDAYVAWTWDAGTSTVTNTSGSISAQVRANPTSGVSVITYSGNGSSGSTVGHGLNTVPSLLICKRRNTTENWCVYHQNVGNSAFLKLDTTGGSASFNAWASTTPTSTVFSIGDIGETNSNIGTYVCYAFAPVAGYSAFGSYTGNASTDGPFVNTGFRPRFLLVKQSNTAGEPWVIHDSVRDSYNGYSVELYPNSNNAEGGPYSPSIFDFLSNGFKLRNSTASAVNGSGGTFVYAAFAESPFQYSRAR